MLRIRAGAVGLLVPLIGACSLNASGMGSSDFLGEGSPIADTRPIVRDSSAADTTVADTEAPDTFVVDTADTTTTSCSDGVQNGTETEVDCGGSCPACTVSASCKELHAARPALPSGVYAIDADGAGPEPSFDAYCDMSTDGGGWTLVLAYNHAAGTAAAVVAGTRPTSPTLGYSHASNAQMLAYAAFDTVRFFCTTSAHTRQLHFKTSNVDAVAYVRGVAMASNTDAAWTTGFTALAGHTANLPASTDSRPAAPFNPAPDLRMTEFPFFKYAAQHWSIAGQATRWECDDWAGATNTTVHQIWIR